MKILLIFFVSLGLSAALQSPPYFQVDISKPPQQRWQGAVSLVVDTHGWDNSFGIAFASHNKTLFDNLLPEHFHLLEDAVKQLSSQKYLELTAIAEEMSAQTWENGEQVYISVTYLAAWVWFHELAHTELASSSLMMRECTAIISQSAAGDLVHGRNMDQSPHQVRNITLQLDFVDSSISNSKVVFRAVDWYWFTTGVVTAMKPGLASIQENWRFANVSSASVLAAAQNGTIPQVWVFRLVFEKGSHPSSAPSALSSFDSVVKTVCTMRLAAPDYLAIAGTEPYQGAVCARTLTGDVWIKYLNGTMISVTNPALKYLNITNSAYTKHNNNKEHPQDWPLLIQTNYDSCTMEPSNDPRCQVATKTIQSMGPTQGSSQVGVFATLSAYPVHNVDTAYSAIMSAKTDTFWTFVRDPLVPERQA